jgi:glycosyltransferase involved in cell wall biosynthesis
LRLTVDTRFAPDAPSDTKDERRVTLEELRQAGPRLGALRRLLGGRRHSLVTVVRDEPSPTAVQAAAMALAGMARGERFEVARGGQARPSTRLRLVATGLGAFAAALPAELWRSAAAYLRLRRELRRPARPIEVAGRPRRVTYLRPAATLRTLGAYVGGAATHTTGVINGMAEHGLDVHVVATERPEGIDGRVGFTPVPVRRLHHFVPWLTATDYSRDVAGAGATHAADVVYQRYTLGSYAGIALARELGVPLVLEYNGSEVWSILHWGSGRLPFAGTLLELEQRNLDAASLVVVVSEVLRDELVERGVPRERVLVNPNGVDLGVLEPLRRSAPHEWRARLGMPDAPTVGFVGSFGLWHGVELIPAIAERLAKTNPDARWCVIGHGGLFDKVRADIGARGLSDRVELAGLVPHERALELLAACDVCVSPHIPNPDGSRFYGSPTKLFEYMGLGKPIAAADLEQIGQVIEHERNGLLFPPGDVDAAAAALARLLDDAALRRRVGAAALEDAVEQHGWDAHVGRLLAALEGSR